MVSGDQLSVSDLMQVPFGTTVPGHHLYKTDRQGAEPPAAPLLDELADGIYGVT